MRYAIISDIHGNLAALQRVLERIEEENCDRIICLGDVVGYGPFPNECCELVQNRAAITLCGNHDAVAGGRIRPDFFTIYAAQAIRWTLGRLNEANQRFLAGLPLIQREGNLIFVHSTPQEPKEWHYLTSIVRAAREFESFSEQICFIGHTHMPTAWVQVDGDIERRTAEFLRILPEERYIINVGSVGQPRDNNPDACFGIWDDERSEFRLVRTAYDIHATQQAMREHRLPDFLIERLAYGR